MQGALEAKEIKRDFSRRRQERGKRSALSFPLAKSWFQQFKGPLRVGQSSSSHKASVDPGRRSVSTSISSLARRLMSYGRIPPAAYSKVMGGVGELSHSYSRGRKVPLCDTYVKIHSGECKRGQQGFYICDQRDHVKRGCPRRAPQSRDQPQGSAMLRRQ